MNFGFRICCRPPADASHRRLRAAHSLLLQMRPDPPQQPPAGSDFGFATHPPGLFNAKAQSSPAHPRNHRGTETQRRHRVIHPRRKHEGTKTLRIHKAAHPLLNAETQRRRESCRRFHRTARFRPSGGGREPLGRNTGPNVNVRHGVPIQRPAFGERRPRHFSSSFTRWEGCTSPTTRKRKERQNRRAQGTSAVEKTDSDGCLRPESSVFSTATGDYRSPVVLPARNGNAFQPQRTPLRVFVSSCLRRGRVGGSVPSVPLWFIRCTLASLA